MPRTLEAAIVEASRKAGQAKAAIAIWRHVGGGTPRGPVPGRGTYLTRSLAANDPKWCVWEKVTEVQPPSV